MAEHDPIIVAIGGTGAPEKTVGEYYEHLVKLSAVDIPLEERFFALHNGGKGHIQDTYDELAERMSTFRRRHVGRKVLTLGHSQGGVHAVRLGVDGLSDGVVTLASPIRGGVTKNLPSSDSRENARRLEADFEPSSPFMSSLRHDIATSWPQDVPLDVIAATYDIIVGRDAQFGAELSGDAAPHEFIIVPSVVLSMGSTAARMTVGVSPRVGMIRSDLPVDHFTIPRASGLPSFLSKAVDNIRDDS